MAQASYIYAIACGDHIKVGKANNPESRLSSIQTGNPLPCALIHAASVPGSMVYQAEKLAHDRLAAHRKAGEWFVAPQAEVVAAIDAAILEASERPQPAPAERPPRSGLDLYEIGIELARETMEGFVSEVLTEQDRFDYNYVYRTNPVGLNTYPMAEDEARHVIKWKRGEPRPPGATPALMPHLEKRLLSAGKRA